MKNLITRSITGLVFIALVIAAIVLYPTTDLLFFVLFLFFSLVATWELFNMSVTLQTKPQKLLPLLLVATLFTAIQLYKSYLYFSMILIMMSLLLLVLIFSVELFRKQPNPLLNLAVVMCSLFWIVLPFSILGMMLQAGARWTVLAIFVVIWLNDTLAYCAGSLFGRHKLFERISPKKSWEGFIIALIMTVIASISFAYIPVFGEESIHGVLQWMLFAFTVVIFGTLGDLVESMLKRNCGVKDSGQILPGHGGILDRFDSSLLAIPPAFIVWFIMTI